MQCLCLSPLHSLQSWPFHCAAVTELVYLHNKENDPENVPLVEPGRTQWGHASRATRPADTTTTVMNANGHF